MVGIFCLINDNHRKETVAHQELIAVIL